jgi:capsule polysaccharide export protein KpsC/LpsZ
MIDFKTKLYTINKLLKMYYFELDTMPQSEHLYRALLEHRIAKIKNSREHLLAGGPISTGHTDIHQFFHKYAKQL